MLATLRLLPPPRRGGIAVAIVAAAAVALLVVAAAQPVLTRSQSRPIRTDAELFVVLDTSRSMKASESPSSPTRLAQAIRFAIRLRAALPEIPAGIASFTDRILPHLLPTSDLSTFATTLHQAVGINRPPPEHHEPVATSYSLLTELPDGGSFSPRARRRLLILLTDGESQPYSPRMVAESLQHTRAGLLIARFWGPRDRIFARNVDTGYRPTLASTGPLAELAAHSVGGHVFSPADVAAAAAVARRFFGAGPTTTTAVHRTTIPLAPWVALLSLLPAGVVLSRRGGSMRPRLEWRREDSTSAQSMPS